MPRTFRTDSLGKPITLYLYNWRATWVVGRDDRPYISLSGTWGSSKLVMDDRKSLAAAFLPDGTRGRGEATFRRKERTFKSPSKKAVIRIFKPLAGPSSTESRGFRFEGHAPLRQKLGNKNRRPWLVVA